MDGLIYFFRVYQDRLKNYRGLLQQLRDGKHDNYVKGVEKLELEKKNELVKFLVCLES